MHDGPQATKFGAANWKISLLMSATVRTQVDSVLPVLCYRVIDRNDSVVKYLWSSVRLAIPVHRLKAFVSAVMNVEGYSDWKATWGR